MFLRPPLPLSVFGMLHQRLFDVFWTGVLHPDQSAISHPQNLPTFGAL